MYLIVYHVLVTLCFSAVLSTIYFWLDICAVFCAMNLWHTCNNLLLFGSLSNVLVIQYLLVTCYFLYLLCIMYLLFKNLLFSVFLWKILKHILVTLDAPPRLPVDGFVKLSCFLPEMEEEKNWKEAWHKKILLQNFG